MRPGDDLAALLAEASGEGLREGDVLVVASKVVSKAEGRIARLRDVEPSPRAREIAAENDKDARLVQLVLDESSELLRAERGVLITETRQGYVCANAGIDQSNVPGDDSVVLLPLDPDNSARALREDLGRTHGVRPAVVITDSFGRPWRLGQIDVAVGAAGLRVLDDWRGRNDREGRELAVTEIAVVDAVAAAADLARAKDAGEPGVLVRGLERFVTEEHGPGAAALRRPREQDLFR